VTPHPPAILPLLDPHAYRFYSRDDRWGPALDALRGAWCTNEARGIEIQINGDGRYLVFLTQEALDGFKLYKHAGVADNLGEACVVAAVCWMNDG
jgi:hypothetical protein